MPIGFSTKMCLPARAADRLRRVEWIRRRDQHRVDLVRLDESVDVGRWQRAHAVAGRQVWRLVAADDRDQLGLGRVADRFGEGGAGETRANHRAAQFLLHRASVNRARGVCATLRARRMPIPDRTVLLRSIVRGLEADERVAAAWLTGSIGRREDDAWSDLDLHVAVWDTDLEALWTQRDRLYARVGQPVLIQRELPSNAQAGSHFQLVIFDGPLEVDWNVGPLGQATRAPANLPLFARADVPVAAAPWTTSNAAYRADSQERLNFLWVMAPIAVKYVARAHTDRAVRQVDLVRDAFVDVWRRLETGQPTLGSLNRPLEPELRRVLPRFGPTIDPATCLDVLLRLCELTVGLHTRLAAAGVRIPERMPEQVARLAAEVNL